MAWPDRCTQQRHKTRSHPHLHAKRQHCGGRRPVLYGDCAQREVKGDNPGKDVVRQRQHLSLHVSEDVPTEMQTTHNGWYSKFDERKKKEANTQRQFFLLILQERTRLSLPISAVHSTSSRDITTDLLAASTQGPSQNRDRTTASHSRRSPPLRRWSECPLPRSVRSRPWKRQPGLSEARASASWT